MSAFSGLNEDDIVDFELVPHPSLDIDVIRLRLQIIGIHTMLVSVVSNHDDGRMRSPIMKVLIGVGVGSEDGKPYRVYEYQVSKAHIVA